MKSAIPSPLRADIVMQSSLLMIFFFFYLKFFKRLVPSFLFPDRPPSGLNNDLLERSGNFVTVAENGNLISTSNF